MKKLCFIALVAVMCALPAMADWSQAESDDFTLDTSIPEPAAALVAAASIVYLMERRER